MKYKTRTTPEEQNAFLAAEYAEANRYMVNARETLTKAKKDGPIYKDRKYVRTACGTAYSGVLVALDAWLQLKGIQPPRGNRRKSIEYYVDNIAKLDGKLQSILISAYRSLHIDGYYDGIGTVKKISAGFSDAEEIIDRIKPGITAQEAVKP